MFIARIILLLNELGISMNISGQSMTTRMEGYICLNESGMVLSMHDLVGQMGEERNLACRKSIHDIIMRDTTKTTILYALTSGHVILTWKAITLHFSIIDRFSLTQNHSGS